jgi:uncharacterized membrane-anchored protein YitT (DUF2179 family)
MERVRKVVKRSPILYSVLQYIFIILGAAIAAFAVEGILVPNSILDGGVTGISMILNYTLGWKLSLCIVLINIPFLYIGFKNMGWRAVGVAFMIDYLFIIVTFIAFWCFAYQVIYLIRYIKNKNVTKELEETDVIKEDSKNVVADNNSELQDKN